MIGNTFALCLVALLALLQTSLSDKITVQVEPKAKDCFYYDATANEGMKLQLFVTRGGLLDIDLRINGPNGQIFSGLVFESSTQEFHATMDGTFEICFSNEMARWTPKIVAFELLIDGADKEFFEKPNLGTEDAVTKGTLDPLHKTVKDISKTLDGVVKDQKYLRIREQRHRDTADNTNSRILTYSIGESVVLIALSLGQVFYLRRVFNVKKAQY
eukprot:TRINITY_DN1318_c0_g3_i1.p1 TRINITY_DN1318_c0_g3~~TRINITY_DN1318_c0_g3_i1.p1  ORF type:complete len:215 (-),score=45.82 TRINITY_DN1318_c0_g3_i1:51-695(-)